MNVETVSVDFQLFQMKIDRRFLREFLDRNKLNVFQQIGELLLEHALSFDGKRCSNDFLWCFIFFY